jgi:hypothetical protein
LAAVRDHIRDDLKAANRILAGQRKQRPDRVKPSGSGANAVFRNTALDDVNVLAVKLNEYR